MAKGQNWNAVNLETITEKGIKDIQPEKYMLFTIDDAKMKALLWTAPSEDNTDVKESPVMINVAGPDGVMHTFKVVRYEMMEPELSEKYPDIKTFYGISVHNPLERIRIDYTNHGFRAVVTSPEAGQFYIDHYQRNDKDTRIVYFRTDYKKAPSWGCNVSDEHLNHVRNTSIGQRIGDCQLRSYRLAQATTGEYSNYHGATSASQSGLVMTAVVNVINRINNVYEAEVAVRLILIGNTANLFYYNAATDPYTNNNGSTMLGENITNCNSVIGSANYDIGHVFSTGGGGVAYLGSVCGSSKAGGVTGSGAPVGDPFTIDYVAHEMGHQFGGNHTFAGTTGSCGGGNRSLSNAMEPGSGSSIMAYAGICTGINVQNNSDATFHARSLQEIKTFIAAGGNNCATIVGSFVNNPPTLTTQGNYSIPISTPFVLTLSATDPEGNPMTYMWDEMDIPSSNGSITAPPASTNTSGPMFRNFLPTTSTSRYFPPIANVIANTTNTWNVLPSVARNMLFRGVARDFTGVAGCNSEINLTVATVNAASGAFSITSQNTATTWEAGLSYTITWNVAGSNTSPVSAANVDILLSYDGGNTYPVTLIAATPNDGSENILVPVGASTTARIMVRGTNHIFFDINNANITITAPASTYNISASPTNVSFCTGLNATSTINVTKVGSFNSPVTLSVSGLPSGAAGTFSVNPVTPDNTSVLTISGPGTPGNYAVTVTGTSGAIVKTALINLTILGTPGTVTLNTPANMATNVALIPTLTWNTATSAQTYDVQVAYDNGFSNTILNANVSTTTYTLSNALYGGTTFYWRVRSLNNCGQSVWSSVRSFTVENCWSYTASGLPANVPTGTNPFAVEINIQDRGVVTNAGVSALAGTYSFIPVAQFEMVSPTAGSTLFWTNPCAKNVADFNIRFADGAASSSYPCPPTDGLEYLPSNPFSVFNNQQMKGKWYININRSTSGSGTITAADIKICPTNFCKLTIDHNRSSGPGSLFDALSCAIDGDTIRFASSLDNSTINLGTQNLVINKRIYIECDISRNIHITSTSSNATIVSSTPNTGEGLKIKGLHIHSSNAGIGAINNSGLLTLEDVNMYKWPGTSTSTITNQPGAVANLSGNCKVIP
jgi:hypothetical protein